MTTAYYLLMKKYLKKGEPSEYDICNENFNRKSLIPKVSKVNTIPAEKRARHQSMDIVTPTNKETIQI